MSDLDDELRKYDSPVWPDGRPDTRRKYGDVLRKTVKRRLKNIRDHHERLIEYLKMMKADNHDTSDEIEEVETLARGLLLSVLLLKREDTNGL